MRDSREATAESMELDDSGSLSFSLYKWETLSSAHFAIFAFSFFLAAGSLDADARLVAAMYKP